MNSALLSSGLRRISKKSKVSYDYGLEDVIDGKPVKTTLTIPGITPDMDETAEMVHLFGLPMIPWALPKIVKGRATRRGNESPTGAAAVVIHHYLAGLPYPDYCTADLVQSVLVRLGWEAYDVKANEESVKNTETVPTSPQNGEIKVKVKKGGKVDIASPVLS